MRQVMLALLPGTAVMTWVFGWGVIINVCLAIVAAMAFESLALGLRRKPIVPALGDGSACVAGWLLALALPPLLPWWITVIGCAAAMLLGKHLYGGLGFNPFNPAMVGYALLLVSFPRDMTAWLAIESTLSLREVIHFVAMGRELIHAEWDAITMATPLDQFRTAQLNAVNNTHGNAHGSIPGRAQWQLINSAFLCGGLYLLFKRIISWHIPVALLAAMAAAYSFDYFLFGGAMSPFVALFSGAAMLGAFFIATDPVSAATSPAGRLIYAAGIGLLVFIIRKWGHYP